MHTYSIQERRVIKDQANSMAGTVDSSPVEKKKQVPWIHEKKKYVIVWFTTIAGLFFALNYSHYGADFTGVSYMQFYGFVTATIASILLFSCGIVGCLYLSRPDSTYSTPLQMLVLMIPELACCILALIFFLVIPLPTKSEMEEFVLPQRPGVFNRALWRLEEEMLCCGVNNYDDYDIEKIGRNFRIPLSCCDAVSKSYAETSCALEKNVTATYFNATRANVSVVRPDHQFGCFSNVTKFEEFKAKAPQFFAVMNFCRYSTIPLLIISLIFVITLIAYFCVYYQAHKKEEVDDALRVMLSTVDTTEHTTEQTTASTTSSGSSASTTRTNSGSGSVSADTRRQAAGPGTTATTTANDKNKVDLGSSQFTNLQSSNQSFDFMLD